MFNALISGNLAMLSLQHGSDSNTVFNCLLSSCNACFLHTLAALFQLTETKNHSAGAKVFMRTAQYFGKIGRA